MRQSRCILNVRNSDTKCFAWSILFSIHPADNNPTHVSNYEPYDHELNMHGISYPIELSKIDVFEKQNVSISVKLFLEFEEN